MSLTSITQSLRDFRQLLLISLRILARRLQILMPKKLAQPHEIIRIVGKELLGRRSQIRGSDAPPAISLPPMMHRHSEESKCGKPLCRADREIGSMESIESLTSDKVGTRF
jgi:hypothetical protein